MNYFNFKDSELYCEDTKLKNIVEKTGTPVYIYSKRNLIEHYKNIDGAFEGIEHITCYAIKANANFELLKILASLGSGADVVSGGELLIAINAGFNPKRIVYAGVGKTDDEIKLALEKNILMLNVESEEELYIVNEIATKMNKIAPVALRINPDIDAKSHPYISTGLNESKFGINIHDALNIYIKAKKLSNINLIGVHIHIGSQILEVEPFASSAKSVNNFVKNLKEHGIEIKYVDFGGGLGVNYHNVVANSKLNGLNQYEAKIAPTPSEWVKAVVPILKPLNCILIIEPGRTMVANTGTLVTKVLYTKKSKNKKFVIVDAGMNDLMRPALYNAYHEIYPLDENIKDVEKVDVVGPICESSDFFVKDRISPVLKRGDLIAIMTAGAYGFSLSSNYNFRPRSAEVLVSGSDFKIIRDREKIDKLV